MIAEGEEAVGMRWGSSCDCVEGGWGSGWECRSAKGKQGQEQQVAVAEKGEAEGSKKRALK